VGRGKGKQSKGKEVNHEADGDGKCWVAIELIC
jgi:hypothetical protein